MFYTTIKHTLRERELRKNFKKKKEKRARTRPRNGEAVQWIPRSRDDLMLRCAVGAASALSLHRALALVCGGGGAGDVKRGRVLARLRRVIVDNMVMNGVVFPASSLSTHTRPMAGGAVRAPPNCMG